MIFTLDELAAALTGGDVEAMRTLLRAAGALSEDAAPLGVPRAAVIDLMARHAGDPIAQAAAELLRGR